MWLRRAVRIPWNVLGAVTTLSVIAVTFPVRALSGALGKATSGDSRSRGGKPRRMADVYDAKEVAVMLKMVQAAMQHKSQELEKERSNTLQLQQHTDDLQESLETVNYLFAQVCCSCSYCQ